MVRLTLMASLLALAACGGGNKPDAGSGGGSGGAGGSTGGGSAGGGAGTGGGGGGGVTGECGLSGTPACDAGHCYQVKNGSSAMTQCLGGACDVVLQDCSGSGQKCAYGVDGGRGCFPDGTLDFGAACGASVSADCKKGSTCVDGPLADGGTGEACLKFCRTDADCVNGDRCYVNLDVGSDELPLVCAPPPPTCDVFTQNCTVSGTACYPTTTGPACYSEGTTTLGGSCMYANDCGPRMTCAKLAGGNGGTTCHLLCSTDGGQPFCPDAGVCGTLTGLNGLGACF